jgi:hypothetical protein
MTAVEVLGRVDELTDGTVRSIDAATVAGIGPYRKSRLMRVNVEAPVFMMLGLRDRLSADSDVVFVNSSVVQRVAFDGAC